MSKNLMNVLRNGSVYGMLFFIMSFLLSHFFGLTLKENLVISIPIGLSALALNGLTYSRFSKSKKKLEAITFSYQHPKDLRFQSAANHMIEDSMIPGKLFLTDTDLVFKVYQKEDKEPTERILSINDLQSFDFFPSLFNTGGEFIAKDDKGQQFVFEVDEIRLWKKAITNTKTVHGVGMIK